MQAEIKWKEITHQKIFYGRDKNYGSVFSYLFLVCKWKEIEWKEIKWEEIEWEEIESLQKIPTTNFLFLQKDILKIF